MCPESTSNPPSDPNHIRIKPSWIQRILRSIHRVEVSFDKHEEKRSSRIFHELCEHLETVFDKKIRTKSHGDQSDAHALEVALLDRLSRIELVAKIQALRQNLREMMVAEDYNELMRAIASATRHRRRLSGSAIVKPSNDELKDEAKALLDRVYRRYLLVPKVENMRRQITWQLLLPTAVTVPILCVAFYLYIQFDHPWFGPVSIAYLSAVVAGALGATVSTLTRLHKIDPRRDPSMLWISLTRGGTWLFLSPALGALFGLLFLLILRSGLVAGEMFPDFSGEGWKSEGMNPGVNLCPGSDDCGSIYKSYTGLLVWCFVAGWAERLVPDVLNSMSDHARSQFDRKP